MHIILRNEPIKNETYKELLSSVSMGTFSTYVYIFNKVQHVNFPYDKNKIPNRRDKFYKALQQLESVGLISITLEDADHAIKTKIWTDII